VACSDPVESPVTGLAHRVMSMRPRSWLIAKDGEEMVRSIGARMPRCRFMLLLLAVLAA
jgi:hypothetical protein